ncbi:MAG TPA: DUF6159 family protein [Mycobacteriales bacterium]
MFPLISGVVSLVLATSFLLPAFALSPDAFDDTGGEIHPGSYLLLFLAYAVLAFVTIFFNAALVHAADRALRGEDFTVRDSLRAASQRIPAILPWTLVSASVSVVLRALEERLGIIGRIVGALVGLAWALVTYLVLPLLVLEGLGVRDAVRRSTKLFKRTWGESVAGNVGIGLATFMLALLALPVPFLVAVLGLVVGGMVAVIALVASVVLVLVWWVGLGVVAGALSGIFQTALYRYAADGWIAPAFAGSDLPHAFPPRRRRWRKN